MIAAIVGALAGIFGPWAVHAALRKFLERQGY